MYSHANDTKCLFSQVFFSTTETNHRVTCHLNAQGIIYFSSIQLRLSQYVITIQSVKNLIVVYQEAGFDLHILVNFVDNTRSGIVIVITWSISTNLALNTLGPREFKCVRKKDSILFQWKLVGNNHRIMTFGEGGRHKCGGRVKVYMVEYRKNL